MADNDELDDVAQAETETSDTGGTFDEFEAGDVETVGSNTSVGELLAPDNAIEPMRTAKDLDAVYDVPVQLSAVLGRANMQVSQLLKLGRGAVVELDRKVGEAIDIYVNNRLIARGEVVVVEERLGVTMTEIIKSDRSG